MTFVDSSIAPPKSLSGPTGKIAITGGSGRIGRAIVTEALRQGHEVVSIDRELPASPDKRPGLRYVAADVTHYDALVQAFDGADGVIHMAAIPSPGHHPDHEVHNNNVVGSYNMMRAAIEVGIRRIVQASSVNAIGLSFSRESHFDYLPLDEEHPNYTEEPYGLSKWICELQADSFARKIDDIRIASMRFHLVVDDRAKAAEIYAAVTLERSKHLWAYTLYDAAARACLLALDAPYKGHEAFYIVGPDTVCDVPSLELAARFFPNAEIRGDLSGHNSFFSSKKAERLLGWRHNKD